MTGSQKALAWTLFFLFIGLVCLISYLCWYESSAAVFWTWVVCATVISCVLAYECIYLLPTDAFLLATFIGNTYELYVPRNNDVAGNQGYFGGLVPMFPPILATGYYLPLPAFNVPFESHGVNTSEGIPMIAFAQLTIQLAPNLKGIRKLVQTFPILGGYWNLTKSTQLKYFKVIDKDGKPQTDTKDVPCIAEIIQRELDQSWNEAVARALSGFNIDEALKNDPRIEGAIEGELKNPSPSGRSTIAVRAGFFDTTVDSPVLVFDINIMGFIPVDPKMIEAVSSKVRETKAAEGVIAKSRGEAEAIKNVAVEASKAGGYQTLAAQTMGKVANLTVVTDPNALLTGVLGTMAGNRPAPPTPPTSTTKTKGTP